jgi:hypothetical protein
MSNGIYVLRDDRELVTLAQLATVSASRSRSAGRIDRTSTSQPERRRSSACRPPENESWPKVGIYARVRARETVSRWGGEFS